MSDLSRYATAGLAFVGLALASARPFVDGDSFRALVAAAALAYPVQLLAFGLMLRYRDAGSTFLAVWLGGSLVRMGLVLAVALLLIRYGWLPPAPALLGLSGLLFGLLLLEPLFFRASDAKLGQVT